MKENNIFKKQLKKYFRDISKRLICEYRIKSKMINNLKNSVYDFISDNSCVSFKNIQEHFGTPDYIAQEINTTLVFDYSKKAKFNKELKIGVLALLVLILIFVGSMAVAIWKNRIENPVYNYNFEITDNGINN